MKIVCKKCGVKKPINQFHKLISDGPLKSWNVRQCKACSKADYSVRYADPKKRERQKRASRNWKAANPEKHAKLAREYRARNKHKITAQNRLNYAIRIGKIIRNPCEICGDSKSHAHHVSYETKDWYNVRWLCQRCHELVHTMS